MFVDVQKIYELEKKFREFVKSLERWKVLMHFTRESWLWPCSVKLWFTQHVQSILEDVNWEDSLQFVYVAHLNIKNIPLDSFTFVSWLIRVQWLRFIWEIYWEIDINHRALVSLLCCFYQKIEIIKWCCWINANISSIPRCVYDYWWLFKRSRYGTLLYLPIKMLLQFTIVRTTVILLSRSLQFAGLFVAFLSGGFTSM